MADLQTFIEINADDNASRTLESVAGKFGGLGSAAGAAHLAVAGAVVGIGAAVAGLAVAAFKLGESFDEAYDRIRVGTGATGAAAEALRDTFRSVASDVPDGLEKVGIAVTEVARRIRSASDEDVGLLAAQFLDLSRITGTDLSENIRLSARVFADWGIESAKQAGTLDLLFRATQQTGVGFASLADNVVAFGSPLRLLGFTLPESIALLAKFEAEGVRTELVMGSLRIALGNLAEAGIPLREGFQELLRVIGNAPSDAQAASLAIQAFGARAGPDMAAAIREGRFAIDGLVESLTEGSETIQGAATDTEDARERMGRAFNQIQLAAEPVADAVFEIAGAVSESLGAALVNIGPDLATFIKSLSPDSTEAAGKAAASTITLTEKLIELSKAVQGVVGWYQALNKLYEDVDAATARTAQGIADFATNALRVIPGVGAALAAQQQALFPRIGPEGPANGGQTVLDIQGEGTAGVGPHPGAEVAGAAVAEAERVINAARSGNRPDISALFKKPEDKEKAKRGGKEIAENAIDGFIEGLQGGDANARAEFGSLGGKLAASLNDAVASNTKSGGVAVARTLEEVVTALREAGVEDWRALGDQLAAALHDALIARTPEQVEAARNMIGAMTATIDAAQFWQKWAKEGEDSAIRINVAIENAAERIRTTMTNAAERIQAVWDNLDLTKRTEEARATVERIVATLRGVQEQGNRDVQRGREDRDVASGRLREDADRRAALEQRIADIRRAGGPNVGVDVRAAQQQFDRETNLLTQRRQREDQDRKQRQSDQAEDIRRLAGQKKTLEGARSSAETALGLTPEQQRRAAAEREIANITKARDADVLKANQDLATLRQSEREKEERFWEDLITNKFPRLKTAYADVFMGGAAEATLGEPVALPPARGPWGIPSGVTEVNIYGSTFLGMGGVDEAAAAIGASIDDQAEDTIEVQGA